MNNTLTAFLLILFVTTAFSQVDEQKAAQEKARMEKLNTAMKVEEETGWNRKAGIGLDLGQLLNINPYVGSGSNRLGIGGAVNYKANFKKTRFSWNNDLLFNLSTQRIGSGITASGSDDKIPFEKALDLLTLNSNLAYRLSETSLWAYSLDLGFRSQLLNSYIDSASQKLYLSEIHSGAYNTSLVSKLFSPALITVAPGMKYSKDPKFYLFLSPIAGQILVIADQDIANLGVHGTQLKDGSSTEYETSKFAFGALAKAGYTNTYFKKLAYVSEISLFSDYLDNPQNIDVVWTNAFGVEIFKGFNISLRADLYYDDDKTNSISDANAPGGISGTGKRINFIEQLLLTYNRNF